MDEKNQMSAPSTRAYFSIQRMPPSSLLNRPMTGRWFISEETREPARFAMRGTMTQSKMNATISQKVGIDRKPVSTFANS